MIKKRLIDGEKNSNHIIITTNEPSRFEITGTFVMHGYKGTRINMKQEPCLFHDTGYID